MRGLRDGLEAERETGGHPRLLYSFDHGALRLRCFAYLCDGTVRLDEGVCQQCEEYPTPESIVLLG